MPTDRPSPPPAEQVEAAQVLAPCPFCDGEPKLLHDRHEVDGHRYWVVCTNCKCDGGPKRPYAEAIAAWNRRPVAALRPVAGVAPEGMREAVQRLNIELSARETEPWNYDEQTTADLRTILAALPPASGSDHGPVGWRAIADAPRDGTRVLGWERGRAGDDTRFTMEWSADKERWVIVCNPFWLFDPTEWQPLPPPPSGDK